MKSKRILIFALFTCVFALYGCVSTVAQPQVFSMTKNISSNTFHNVSNKTKISDLQTAMPLAQMQAVIEGNTQKVAMVRDVDGNLKATSSLKKIASTYQAKVKTERKKLEEKKKALAKQKEEENAKKFDGKITTYGVDCYGCSNLDGRGGTASGVALDMNAGVEQANGSFNPGIKYGNYYVVAADPSIPMYSILKISNHGLSGSGISPDQPFYAIVLDRGGAIYGGHLDLYIGSEDSNAVVQAVSATPTIQIVRTGA